MHITLPISRSPLPGGAVKSDTATFDFHDKNSEFVVRDNEIALSIMGD